MKEFLQIFTVKWSAFAIGLLISLAIAAGTSATHDKDGVTVGVSVIGWLGAVIFGGCLSLTVWREKSGAWSAGKLSGQFGYPTNGVSVPQSIDINGTLSGKLPDDTHLWIIRHWPDLDGYIVEALITRPLGHAWSTRQLFVGGDTGNRRTLELWVVGPTAHEYLTERRRIQAAIHQELEGGDPVWRPITQAQRWKLLKHIVCKTTPPDVKKLHQVEVFSMGASKP
jgi:hypothetical protein